MANWWQIATSLDAAGARAASQKTANETKLMRQELEKQNELLRRSMLTPEEKRAEDDLKMQAQVKKQKNRIETSIFVAIIIYIGLWFSEPVIAIGITVIGIIALIILTQRKNREEKTPSQQKKNHSGK